jgi:hypothetical protein
LFPVSSLCSQSSCCFMFHLSVHYPPVVSCLLSAFTILLLFPVSFLCSRYPCSVSCTQCLIPLFTISLLLSPLSNQLNSIYLAFHRSNTRSQRTYGDGDSQIEN